MVGHQVLVLSIEVRVLVPQLPIFLRSVFATIKIRHPERNREGKTIMIHIKYKLDKSKFHGIGLFADQDVKKSDLIYSASPALDLNISQEKFDALTDNEKEEIKYWGFWIEADKVWHVDFDNSKFLNHSHEGNVTQDFSHPDAWLVAARDIQAGEELTQNYLEFETEEDLKRRGISA